MALPSDFAQGTPAAWLRRHDLARRRLGRDHDLRPLLALLAAGPYFPDFLTPNSESVLGDVARELDEIRATPSDRARADAEARAAYEQAQTPWDTDQLNEKLIGRDRLKFSPLGDPVPFSCNLIGQLVNDTGYSTQFNLDSDRAFAYLTWDWIRNDPKAKDGSRTGILGLTYATPVAPPENDPRG